jgi:hypothetical protein
MIGSGCAFPETTDKIMEERKVSNEVITEGWVYGLYLRLYESKTSNMVQARPRNDS